MVDRNAGQWMDLMVRYFDRVQQIAEYLSQQGGQQQVLWNELAQACARHQTLVQGLKAKLLSGEVVFDASVLKGPALESAVEYMGFIVQGLSRHKYSLEKLVNLVGDFEQNVLDSLFFTAFRGPSGQDAQAISQATQEVTDLRARILPLEVH